MRKYIYLTFLLVAGCGVRWSAPLPLTPDVFIGKLPLEEWLEADPPNSEGITQQHCALVPDLRIYGSLKAHVCVRVANEVW